MPHRPAESLARAVLLTGLVVVGTVASAQTPTDPREARPERPTVATHAYAVAPGIVELEAGVQWLRTTGNSGVLSGPTLFKIGLRPGLQLDLSPNWAWAEIAGAGSTSFSDFVAGVKWQLADHVPVLADFSVQPTLKMPTGSWTLGTGTGTWDISILAISSRQLGPVSLDINAGYTRRSGDGTHAPKDSTVWTVSGGFAIGGRLQWDAELFGFPGTSGPTGYRPIVAFLTGPTYQVQRSVVLDAGVIVGITGFGKAAVYSGVTWNMGYLPGRASHFPAGAPPR